MVAIIIKTTKVYKSLYLVLTILLLVAHLNFRLVQQFSIQGTHCGMVVLVMQLP